MAASFGELVLVVGDMHIPHRAVDIADQFKKILVPNKVQHVLCTGNMVTSEQLDYLRTLAPRVHVVRGDFDEDDTLPETKVVSVGEFKIGLCHGHQLAPVGEPQSLALLRRQLDVDVLVTGATHRNSILEYDGHCFVNPGSITGAYNPSTDIGEITPSFMLMSIQEAKIEFFLYEISAAGKLKVTRSSYTKPESGLAV